MRNHSFSKSVSQDELREWIEYIELSTLDTNEQIVWCDSYESSMFLAEKLSKSKKVDIRRVEVHYLFIKVYSSLIPAIIFEAQIIDKFKVNT